MRNWVLRFLTKVGTRTAVRMPTTATTMTSSTIVNPFFC